MYLDLGAYGSDTLDGAGFVRLGFEWICSNMEVSVREIYLLDLKSWEVWDRIRSDQIAPWLDSGLTTAPKCRINYERYG